MSVEGAGGAGHVGPVQADTVEAQAPATPPVTEEGGYGQSFDPGLPDQESVPVTTEGAVMADDLDAMLASTPVAQQCVEGEQTPEQQAIELLADFENGNVEADDLLQRADDMARTMPPEQREAFYRTLADAPELEGVEMGGYGQCYQDGNISGETPTENLRIPASQAFGHAAERAAFQGRMEETLGFAPADPNDLDQVRDYMDLVSQQGGPQAVQEELQSYLTNFYTHGTSVNYNPPETYWGSHSPDVGDIQSRTLSDGGGRRVIDCDGYAALAQHLTEGIDGGRYDFQWGYTSGPGGAHMMGAVIDTETGRGFTVDNNDTSIVIERREGESSADAARRGMNEALSSFHATQNITAGGLGVGGTYSDAVSNQP